MPEHSSLADKSLFFCRIAALVKQYQFRGNLGWARGAADMPGIHKKRCIQGTGPRIANRYVDLFTESRFFVEYSPAGSLLPILPFV